MKNLYKLNSKLYRVMFFLHPLELIKKIMKIGIVSREIFLNRITYYPITVINFENNFAKYIGMKYGLTFCNGTSSIEAALFALDIQEGDEVLVPSCTFHASIDPIVNRGAIPVFVDTENDGFIISINDMESKITQKTKCIVVVHLFGYVANIQKVSLITKKHNLKLIEDVSHAHGAKFKNSNVGSFADISCFSLQGAKAVAAGEGGIALTNREELLSKMSMYGHFNRHSSIFSDKNKKYSSTGIGHKGRAHPLGIAMASVDLKFLNYSNKNMLKNERYIRTVFKNFKGIKLFDRLENTQSGGFFGGIPILIEQALYNIDDIINTFDNYGITVTKYPFPLHHRMEIYNLKNTDTLSNTEYLHDNLLLIDRRLLGYLPINMKYSLNKALKDIKEI